MPASASSCPSCADVKGPWNLTNATAPATGATHENRSPLVFSTNAESSAMLRRIITMLRARSRSEARSTMIAWSSLARDGQAVPKYCASTSACLMPRSRKASPAVVVSVSSELSE